MKNLAETGGDNQDIFWKKYCEAWLVMKDRSQEGLIMF